MVFDEPRVRDLLHESGTDRADPGYGALGIKVLPSKGGRLPPRRALVRVIGLLAAAIPFFAGSSLILVTERRRGLQDLLARTVSASCTSKRSGRPSHIAGVRG